MAPKRPDLVRDPLGVPKLLFGGASQALQNVADFANRYGIGLARTAKAGPNPLEGDPTGRYAPGFMQQPFQAPSAPLLPPAAAVTGVPAQRTVPVVRSEDDQYRQLLSQYGALQKEKKFEEADKLGMQIWQQKYGKTPMGQPGGAVGQVNPLMERTFGYQTGESPRAKAEAFNVPQGFDVSSSFSLGANAVPAPWNTQGEAVSAPYQEAMSKAFDKTNPMNLISQEGFSTEPGLSDRIQKFLAARQ